MAQIVLLAVAVCGNTFVNYVRLSLSRAIQNWATALQMVAMLVILFFLSMIVAISLLNSLGIGLWLTVVVALGIIDLILSYRVDMDLALVEAKLL